MINNLIAEDCVLIPFQIKFKLMNDYYCSLRYINESPIFFSHGIGTCLILNRVKDGKPCKTYFDLYC